MKFSIITPNLNQGQFLSQCIESVRVQSEPHEHIVVDGGSTDGTQEILNQYAGCVTARSCQSQTAGAAIHLGLQSATGEVIGWLGSDDYYDEAALTKVSQFLTDHPEIDVVYGHVRDVDEDGEFLKLRKASRWSPDRLLNRCLINLPACFYRRSVLDKFGSLDPGLTFWFDYEYWLRLSREAVRFSSLEKVLGSRRHRPEANRYGNVCDQKAVQADEELCNIQRNILGRISAKAALSCGARHMINNGIKRETTMEYDRGVLSIAYDRFRNCSRVPRTRLLLHHCGREAMEILKRPRFLVRFLPGPLNRLARTHLRHRVFADSYSDPRPVSIPDDYLAPVELNDPPKISMVTPNLNQGPFIEATIRSILDQNYPNLEFIIQDGVSSDDSLEIIRRYESSLKYWDSSPDHGQAHAINKGMQHTTGEIMAFLNSDDLLIPGSLAYVAQYFQQHPEVDVVYGHRILVDDNGDEISRWVLPPHDDTTITYADYIPQETMFWRRRAWEAIGEGLDDSFQFALDWDLIVRFREAGMRFERLPRFLGAFRVTETQKTSALIRTVGEREMRRIRNRIFGRHPSKREIRRHVKPYLRRQWVYDICYKLGFAHY